MKFSLAQDLTKSRDACLILGISEKGELTPASTKLSKSQQSAVQHFVKHGVTSPKLAQIWIIPAADTSIMLVGCGKSLTVTPKDFSKIITASIKSLEPTRAKTAISTLTELTIENRSLAWKVKYFVEVANAALYGFTTYKSEKAPLAPVKEISLYTADKKSAAACQEALKLGVAVADGVTFTKDLANQPSNICTPTYLAEQARQLGKKYRSLKVTILDEKAIQKLGMGAFLAVTKGTAQPAKLVCLEYKGTSKKQAPVALVGKGITFDTGGISLKPSESMVGMKYDMCGAATVLGTIKTAAELKLPLHIVGILAIAENMPGGAACKPEDIVTTMSGQTVEILNTDAEGRLVLCDALTYCERFKPDVVIDIATLTGAVVVALGQHATGLLSNNEKLTQELLAAGTESHDRAWQLPLWDEYQEQIRSPFADMANTGGRMAGTITAACFLARFAKKFQWAHLDVAGTAAMMSGVDRYATGRPVPMLTQFLINRCKKK